MIEYSRGAYGANLLLRWHGSALAKAFIPGLLSVTIYLLLHYVAHYDNDQQQQQQSSTEEEEEYNKLFNHPYAIGVLVSSVSFLIIFRANYGYQRYWEACSTTTQFMSKWMDAAVFASVFHLQSQNNKGMKPPSFYDYDELNNMNLTRDREGMGRESFGPPSSSNEYIMSDERSTSCFISERSATSCPEDRPLNTNYDQESGNDHPTTSSARSEMLLSMRSDTSGVSKANSLRSHNSLRRRRYTKSINDTNDTRGYSRTESDAAAEHLDLKKHLLGPPRLDGGWGKLYQNEINGKCTATYYDIQSSNKMENKKQRLKPPDGKGFASTQGGRTPSLFLQELTHLSSLLVAVALSTLRNDMDDVESPLDVYTPGQTWPAVDPINLPKDVKHQAYEHRRFTRNIRYLLGMDQTKRSRTIYNAARPMLVLGGVSDNEIAFLQRARGPYAKTQLCWSWLSDFIIREHLAGSMGDVGPPIVSRLVQFLSDGMIYYNHARKIMFTPFPFPHAQLSAFFVLMMMVAIPFLMDQYANHVWLGATLTFLTVTCLAGLHEVARELENPFRNAPNDVPLCTLLAFYNEALITTFAGFHPDSYWDQADVLKKRKKKSSTATNDTDDGTMMKDDDPLLVPELPINGHGCGDERERPSSAIPQSTVDEIDINLKELREMIDCQASKIKELQARVQNKGHPQNAPS